MAGRRSKTARTAPRPRAGAATAVADPDEGKPGVVTATDLLVGPTDEEGVPLISKEMVLAGRSGGLLRLSPFQKRLDDEQRAALVSIGIDTNADPGIQPHIRPFIHLCQSRGLDPWLKEAYLIGRGTGNYRRYTMQVGIDGYLKIAKATKLYRRIAARLWTGQDDDPATWREVEDQFGNTVMKRVWFDQWPESRGHPGAAKVIIEHYDDQGQITFTEGQADWAMFAPYTPVYEGQRPNRRKVLDESGKPVLELGEFWLKGGPHMLAKCALALAIRQAFPGATAGILTTEEMHQADAIEIARLESERMDAIKQRAAAQAAPAQQRPAPADGPVDEEEAALLGEEPAEPMVPPLVEPSGPETIEPEPPEKRPVFDEDTRRAWLLDELDLMAEVLGTSVAALTRRWAAGAKKNVSDPTVPVIQIQQLVAGLRPMAIETMRSNGSTEAADAWQRVQPDDNGVRDWLLGVSEHRDGAIDGEVVGEEGAGE
jgi:phage recombination protein Bet